ncbi:hypothetical protein [Neolewinella sp.]|uniref:hypothetical protein n=1 Tax=Neolewinella sp. TaxID=2993543 RepID=UPI003B5250E5
MKTILSLLFLILPLLIFAQQNQQDTASLRTGYRDAAGANRVPQERIDIPPTVEALQATLYELEDEYLAVHQTH